MTTHNGTPQRWTDEQLDRLAGIVSDLVDVQRQRDDRVDRLAQAITQLADVQLEFARGMNDLRQGMNDLQQGMNDFRQGLDALRAGQEQQSRVLDYLLKKEQDRTNGGSS